MFDKQEVIMGEIIDLEEMRKQFSKKPEDKDEENLDNLYKQIEALVKKWDEEEGEIIKCGHSWDDLSNDSFTINPSTTALYNAYYTLIAEDREDLAELVSDIIKMV